MVLRNFKETLNIVNYSQRGERVVLCIEIAEFTPDDKESI